MGAKRNVFLLMWVVVVGAKSIAGESTSPRPTLKLDNFNNSLLLSSMASSPYENIANSLYNEVISRDFNTAVHRTALLADGGEHDFIIINAVNKLIDNERSEIFDFAYKLKAVGGTFIIKDCFPKEFDLLEKYLFSKIINVQDNFLLKFSDRSDSEGDRTGFGDPDISRTKLSVWAFVYTWVDDGLFFKIRPKTDPIYLKLSVKKDSDGDYGAYGSKSYYGTDRHLWYLKPVKHNGKLLFYIINKEHNAALKLGRAVDGDGDRQAYGHPDLSELTPEKFAWEIKIIR